MKSGDRVLPGTVFVLAGGGNLGAGQVGMLYALLEAGIGPDAIVGTSVGALNGAFLSGHCDLEGVEKLADTWASIRRSDVFPVSIRNIARGLLGRRNYVFESMALQGLIARAQLGYRVLEQAPIPTHVVATDLDTGEAVLLSEGPVNRALLASAAIPGLFPPVEIGGRKLVDGGIVANVPVLEAESLGASTIYVLPTVPEQVAHVPSNVPAMMQRAMLLASRPSETSALSQAAKHTELHVLPAPDIAGRLSIFDFGATRELIDQGYSLAREWLGDAPPKSTLPEPTLREFEISAQHAQAVV